MTWNNDDLSGDSRREQLDKIWQYICQLPKLDSSNCDNKEKVEIINERLKLIETILKHKKEETFSQTVMIWLTQILYLFIYDA